ncbi:MmgE/PrpD family protein [Paraburkholderia phytofirmans]
MIEKSVRASSAHVEAAAQYEHILFPSHVIHVHAGRLARFLADLTYEAIPDDVLQRAKRITLDTIGCIVAGAERSLGKKWLF